MGVDWKSFWGAFQRSFSDFWKNPALIKSCRWLLFTVIFALIPLAGVFLHPLFLGKPAALQPVVAHGELLIISVALAADALGDLIASSKAWEVPKLVAGGVCAISIGLASLLFSEVYFDESVRPEIVLTTSLWIFGTTLIVSGCCKILAD
jgi:hypothetical protein